MTPRLPNISGAALQALDPDSLDQSYERSKQHQILTGGEFFGSSNLSDVPRSSRSNSTSPLKSEHDPYFRQQDEYHKTASIVRPPIPANLLEQIRKRHNLTPVQAEGLQNRTVSPGLAGDEYESSLLDRPKAQATDDRTQEDDLEEHISSAVYFPHPGPTPEEIEQFTSPGEEGFAVDPDTASKPPGILVAKHGEKRSLNEATPAERIDISVESKHEKSIFHGNYQPLDEGQDDDTDLRDIPAGGEKLAESGSSESEADFGDELGDSSQTEDGETTPTATPLPKTHSQRKKRTSIGAGPKGAVMLEPYSHQVGGHSTIFRFSRRAVCKQLNNRENEFYERIERRHPDMLRFLPRSVSFCFILLRRPYGRRSGSCRER